MFREVSSKEIKAVKANEKFAPEVDTEAKRLYNKLNGSWYHIGSEDWEALYYSYIESEENPEYIENGVIGFTFGDDDVSVTLSINEGETPLQAFINRIAKWTDAVYVTTIYESYEILTNTKGDYISTEGFKAMNGNIIVSCGIKDNTYGVGLYCSNNYIKLKDSEWFNLKVVLDGVERRIRVWPN